MNWPMLKILAAAIAASASIPVAQATTSGGIDAVGWLMTLVGGLFVIVIGALANMVRHKQEKTDAKLEAFADKIDAKMDSVAKSVNEIKLDRARKEAQCQNHHDRITRLEAEVEKHHQ